MGPAGEGCNLFATWRIVPAWRKGPGREGLGKRASLRKAAHPRSGGGDMKQAALLGCELEACCVSESSSGPHADMLSTQPEFNWPSPGRFRKLFLGWAALQRPGAETGSRDQRCSGGLPGRKGGWRVIWCCGKVVISPSGAGVCRNGGVASQASITTMPTTLGTALLTPQGSAGRLFDALAFQCRQAGIRQGKGECGGDDRLFPATGSPNGICLDPTRSW